MSQDLTDIVTMMLKVDANHDPSEANELLSAGAREIKRLRAALADVAEIRRNQGQVEEQEAVSRPAH
jgi:hypothetical protein